MAIQSNDNLFWLYADNYRTYNVEVAKKFKSLNVYSPIHVAILLSELASRYRYHRDRNELTSDPNYGDGWFYYTQEDLEERTLLTRKNQDTNIEILEKEGLIEKRSLGLPAKRHFRLNLKKIQEFFFSSDGQTSLSGPDNQLCIDPPNTIVRARQPAPYIYKHKEEPKDNKTPPTPLKGEDASASCVSNKIPFQSYGRFVKLEGKEHSSLVEKFGEPFVNQIIEEMNDYLSASGKKPYKDYAAAIRQWCRKKKTASPSSYSNSKYPDRRQRYADGSLVENPWEGVF